MNPAAAEPTTSTASALLAAGRSGSLSRSVLMALGALAIHGSWAFAANFAHGFAAGARAFAAQGAISVLNTFLSTLLIERLITAGRSRRAGFLLATTGAAFAGGAATVLAHCAAGTPNLAITALGSIAMGTFYAAFYSLGLLRMVHRREP